MAYTVAVAGKGGTGKNHPGRFFNRLPGRKV